MFSKYVRFFVGCWNGLDYIIKIQNCEVSHSTDVTLESNYWPLYAFSYARYRQILRMKEIFSVMHQLGSLWTVSDKFDRISIWVSREVDVVTAEHVPKSNSFQTCNMNIRADFIEFLSVDPGFQFADRRTGRIERLTLLLRIWEVPGLYLCPQNGCPE